MATGRIGVTPTLGTRWSKAPAGGTTSLSGLDDNSVSLVYSVGYEQVYRNGVLLSRGNDYTATTGNSITLIDATIAGDIIEVFANELVPLTDAISKGQFTAKGALLSATAASTPAVLTVGSNDQVLTADSTTSTGLKWAAVSGGAGNMAQIATGTLSSSSVTISSLSSYTELLLHIYSATTDAAGTTNIRVNNNSGSNYDYIGAKWEGTAAPSRISQQSVGEIQLISNQNLNSSAQQAYAIRFFNCKNPGFTSFDTTIASQGTATFNVAITKGIYKVSEAVSSLRIFHSGGNWTAGTYILWGA